MSTTFLLPGSALPASSSSKLKLGPGTAVGQPSAAGQFVATKMGLLRTSRGKDGSERMWVEGRSKRVSYASSHARLSIGVFALRVTRHRLCPRSVCRCWGRKRSLLQCIRRAHSVKLLHAARGHLLLSRPVLHAMERHGFEHGICGKQTAELDSAPRQRCC